MKTQDLREFKVITSNQLNSISNGNSVSPVANPASAKEEECPARPDNDIATYHK